jgi:predicted O-methyltransferase YrrM
MTLDEILQSGQPYFGEFLISEQGPYEKYLPHFRSLLKIADQSAPHSNSLTVLEVGSWAGASLHTWDQAAYSGANFIAIDQWAPYFNNNVSETHRIMDEAARSGQIEQLFWHNMKVLGIDKRLKVIKEASATALIKLDLTYESFDIVFIDGDHRYQTAKFDIVGAAHLVRDGGVLCGDDLQLQYHELQDHAHHQQMISEGQSDAHDAGRSYHPGVTQAIVEVFGQVSTADRLWAMQKRNGAWHQIEF